MSAKNPVTVRAVASRKVSGIKSGNNEDKKTYGGEGGNNGKNEDWMM